MASYVSRNCFPEKAVQQNGLSRDIERVKSAMEILGTSCMVCWMLGDGGWTDHSVNRCQKVNLTGSGFLAFEKGLGIPSSLCKECLLPLKVSQYLLIWYGLTFFSSSDIRHLSMGIR